MLFGNYDEVIKLLLYRFFLFENTANFEDIRQTFISTMAWKVFAIFSIHLSVYPCLFFAKGTTRTTERKNMTRRSGGRRIPWTIERSKSRVSGREKEAETRKERVENEWYM